MVEVLSPGLYSSVQDLGRYGYRRYGVPLSGVMDDYSAKLANQIVGNDKFEPVIEVTIIGPKLKFYSDCLFAICGSVFKPMLDHQPIDMNQLIHVKAGQVLMFRQAKLGMRAYIAFRGGLKTEQVMGSTSQMKSITSKSNISKGDRLELNEKSNQNSTSNAVIKISPIDFTTDQILVEKGPEFDRLDLNIKKHLLSQNFTISSQSNRMGYRLENDLQLSAEEIITGPVQPGTVQLTPSGQLIILGRDAQTTGGYARVLQLKHHSQNILAQKTLGSTIKFKLI